VCRLAHGGVVHAEVAADRPHDHVARIQADTDLDRDALRPVHLFRVLGHRLLHPERGVASTHGVVLVRQRRAEEGHDPVAHHLVDGALEAMDGLHHALEHRIEELPRFFGVAVGEQLHRPLEVRK
jgi:hypothetical protein